MIRVAESAKGIGAGRLVSVTCLRAGEGFTVFYHFSTDEKEELMELRADVPAGEEVETLAGLFPNAELFESEATELYGVRFSGNPSSGKRLFLEEK